MANVLSSVSKFIIRSVDTATHSVGSVEKALDMVNHYVTENHKRVTKNTTVAAKIGVAEFNEEVAQKLNANASLKAQYDAVCLDW